MDLVLWRHAEAEEAAPSGDDRARELTAKGRKHAQRMGQWLDICLPANARVWASPAARTVQTADALGRKYRLREVLGTESSADAVLSAVNWPQEGGTMLLVGHQPVLGELAARLLGVQAPGCAIRKGTVWWLRHRVRDGEPQTVLVTVQTPDLLLRP
jgi:phosphohistidine phosphatase